MGINVEFVTFQSSDEMLPALATDQVQTAGGIISLGLFNAIARGIDVKIIGDMVNAGQILL
ncbi:MAG: hypothetical protein U0401_13885 [Anaerolineae bacterium]